MKLEATYNQAPAVKVGFVIGPFSAPNQWEIEENIRNAEKVGRIIVELGAIPIIPHANTRLFYGLAPEEFFRRGYLEILKRCDFCATVEILGLSWRTSGGSVGEIQMASVLNIPVFHSKDELAAWLNKFNF